MFVRTLLLALLILYSLGSSPVVAAESSKFLALGTGTMPGLFHPVGLGICRLLNEGRLEHGYRCLAYPTGAAVNNLQGIDSGDLDIGMSYANLLQEARNAVGPFAGEHPLTELKLVTYLYEMPLLVIYNKDLPVERIADLAGLRIDIGNVGSGKRAIAETIFTAMGWSGNDFAFVSESGTREVQEAFCRGDIDVMIEAISFEDAWTNRVTKECNGKFLSIDKVDLKKMVEVSPGLGAMTVPGGQYTNNAEAVNTVSVNVILVTSERVNADAIYTLTKSMYSNFEKFRALNPIESSRFRSFIKRDKSLPFHEGAIRYYEEQGWDYK